MARQRIVLELHVEEDGEDVGAVFQETAARLEVTPSAAAKLIETAGAERLGVLGEAIMEIMATVFRAPRPAPFPPAVAFSGGKSAVCAAGGHDMCPKRNFPSVPCTCSCHNLAAVP